MASQIEFEFFSKTDDVMATASIICTISSMDEEDRLKLKEKLHLLTYDIRFIDPNDDNLLRKTIASTSGFGILLIDCCDFLAVASIRNYSNETMPIYIQCSDRTATCSEESYFSKVKNNDFLNAIFRRFSNFQI